MSRPVRRRHLHTPWAAVLVLLGVALLMRLWAFQPAAAPLTHYDGTFAVKRVVDGDTLLLTNRTRLRLIGVDTPETKRENFPVEPFGPEATRFTEQFIGSHEVQLRYDGDPYDAHGRKLAYVYVEGKLLNEALLRAGLARARTEFHYAQPMKDLFRAAENEAKQNRRGIWSLDPKSRHPTSRGR